MPSVSASSSALINSKGPHNSTSMSAAADALNFDATVSGAINASEGDVYDPDQPLWNKEGHETSLECNIPILMNLRSYLMLILLIISSEAVEWLLVHKAQVNQSGGD